MASISSPASLVIEAVTATISASVAQRGGHLPGQDMAILAGSPPTSIMTWANTSSTRSV